MSLLAAARRRTPLLLIPAVLLAAACAPEQTDTHAASTPAATPSPPEHGDARRMAPEPDAASAGQTCPPEGVRLTPGLVDAALGARGMRVTLTNCGTEPYTVEGYPVFTVLDEDAALLDVEQERSATAAEPPAEVVVPPGGSAYTVLEWRNTVTDVTRPATLGTELSFLTSEDGATQSVFPDGGLDLGTTDLLKVTPWTAAEAE
ncbi:DUF4232 domain-containing protein [Streptomyces sp. NPDC049879]|uniref:DUF4232 domain-containing protein n=1 Tax=Streptomyces sp. NPDC049879 TaxID=3365598 RepID=UPI0037B5AF8B